MRKVKGKECVRIKDQRLGIHRQYYVNLTSAEVLFTLIKQIVSKLWESKKKVKKTERVSSCWTCNEITHNLVLKPVLQNMPYTLQK